MLLYLVRHGETEWSKAGRHTGRTDLPLTAVGEEEARALGARLAGHRFDRVLSSPLRRALDTARLAGFGDRAEPSDRLLELDYGHYDGRTRLQVRAERPGWDLFRDGCPGGETATQVAERVRPLLADLAAADATALLFAHGHLLRILAATYLGLPPDTARYLYLGTASLSVLGVEHDWPAVRHWNDQGHLS